MSSSNKFLFVCFHMCDITEVRLEDLQLLSQGRLCRLTLDCQKMTEAMIQEFLRPEFRYKLRDALDGSEGDMVKQAGDGWVLAVGSPPKRRCLALGKLLHDCPDLVAKNQTLVRLVRDPDSGAGDEDLHAE
eukprot:Skav218898  [mRNA]  locus=scaffold328:286522:287769:+ [translate_table: standard]